MQSGMTLTIMRSRKSWMKHHEARTLYLPAAGNGLKMDLRYDQIPAELTRLDRWVTWRYEKRNDTLTKPPYVPDQKKKR